MSKGRAKSEEIRKFIVENVVAHPKEISKITTLRFDITRQAVNRHLQTLVSERILGETGNTRNRVYRLCSLDEWKFSYPIKTDLAEDIVWRNDISNKLGQQSPNVVHIWQYGFTEMLNNAIDHSEGRFIHVSIARTAVDTEISIKDDGIGIFNKIKAMKNLLDERHAILELAKGKLTTDPDRHSGEGIFFTSRMFDSFSILSGDVHFNHKFGKPEDWILETGKPESGTTIILKLSNNASRTTTGIFNEYSDGDNYGFNKTVVPVRLAQYGDDRLVSRSQARRVLERVELFKHVIFDFTDVDAIGQAFADEIFRVFASTHPAIEMTYCDAIPDVEKMILRSLTPLLL